MSGEDLNIGGAPPEGAPEWMCTFADLMSLLLCFFVLLLSFSETDKAKYKEVAGSLEKAFGVQRKIKAMGVPKGVTIVAKDFEQQPVPVYPREEFIATQMEKAITEELNRNSPAKAKDRGEIIKVEAISGEVRLRIMGEASFDTGKAELKAEIIPLLARVAAVLNNHAGDIVVAGHTDNVPLLGGPYRSNLGLSMARSAAVADYFITIAGLKAERVATMGFGEYRPAVSNSTEEGRRRNRRVEVILKPAASPGQDLAGGR
jgi:chemotaxis protein MotB